MKWLPSPSVSQRPSEKEGGVRFLTTKQLLITLFTLITGMYVPQIGLEHLLLLPQLLSAGVTGPSPRPGPSALMTAMIASLENDCD